MAQCLQLFIQTLYMYVVTYCIAAPLSYIKWAIYLSSVRVQSGGRLIALNGTLAVQQDVHLQVWRLLEQQDDNQATYALVYDILLNSTEQAHFEVSIQNTGCSYVMILIPMMAFYTVYESL